MAVLKKVKNSHKNFYLDFTFTSFFKRTRAELSNEFFLKLFSKVFKNFLERTTYNIRVDRDRRYAGLVTRKRERRKRKKIPCTRSVNAARPIGKIRFRGLLIDSNRVQRV